MLAVILKILSVIGILLLVILGILLVLILLILFFPIFYKIHIRKDPQNFFVSAKAGWLFGLFRVRCIYPDPGNITAKILFFKVFDSSVEKQSDKSDPENDDAAQDKAKEAPDGDKLAPEKDTGGNDAPDRDQCIKSDSVEDTAGKTETGSDHMNAEKTDAESKSKENIFSGISSKYKKLEYTIQKFYDKIKEICENIEFYKKLLTEDNTKELLKHAFVRLCRILKNIRPRKLKANIIFGAATPDVTGYIYGVYGMLCSALGRDFYLEPDFTRQVLEGELSASGHITVFTILFNAAMVLFDKKLKILRIKLKRHSLGKNKCESH